MHSAILTGKFSYNNSFSKPEIIHQPEQDYQAFPKCKVQSHFPTYQHKNEGAAQDLMCWCKADAAMSELLFPLQHWLSTNNKQQPLHCHRWPLTMGLFCPAGQIAGTQREIKKKNCFPQTPRAALMPSGHFYLHTGLYSLLNPVRENFMFLWWRLSPESLSFLSVTPLSAVCSLPALNSLGVARCKVVYSGTIAILFAFCSFVLSMQIIFGTLEQAVTSGCCRVPLSHGQQLQDLQDTCEQQAVLGNISTEHLTGTSSAPGTAVRRCKTISWC